MKAYIHFTKSLLIFLALLNLILCNIKNEEYDTPKEVSQLKGSNNFWTSFFSGFNLIFISEIGDNTFLLCLFFSVKIGVIPAFIITSITLVILNFCSLLIGATLPIFVYQKYINWIAVFVFLFFAIYLFIQGIQMENKLIIEDYHELEVEQTEKDTENVYQKLEDEENKAEDNQNKVVSKVDNKINTKKPFDFNVAWSFALSLVLAEFGDKSQITAFAIAAIYDFKAVLLGSSLAHIMATLIAVSIGYYFSSHVTEKIITLMGSLLFFIYSVSFFLSNVYE